MLQWPDKDPDERLDYAIHWHDEMDAVDDEIIESKWFIEGDDETLKVESDGLSGATTYVWLEKGEHGRGYTLTNRIWTADGRIYDRSVLLVVMHK